VDYKLKAISKQGIPEALAKVELYRYLNEPEESESICRDILATDPEQQLALRFLGLSITDQFTGGMSDRYNEAEGIFARLKDPYERLYYTGLLCERQAKSQLRSGRSPHTVFPLLEQALAYFSEAESVRPPGNDDAILRWNRCVRLLQSPHMDWEEEVGPFEAFDAPPR
jgi:tetratricopeptide (TPR) repeat protein